MWLVLLGTCPYFLFYILWPFLVNFIGWIWYIYSVNSSSVSMLRVCAKGDPTFKATMSGGHLTRKTPSPYTPEATVPVSSRYQYILTIYSLFNANMGSYDQKSHIREKFCVMTKKRKNFFGNPRSNLWSFLYYLWLNKSLGEVFGKEDVWSGRTGTFWHNPPETGISDRFRSITSHQ